MPDIKVEQTAQTGSPTKEGVPAPSVEKTQPSPAKSSTLVNKLREAAKSLKTKIASFAQKQPAIANKLKQQLQQLEQKIKALMK